MFHMDPRTPPPPPPTTPSSPPAEEMHAGQLWGATGATTATTITSVSFLLFFLIIHTLSPPTHHIRFWWRLPHDQQCLMIITIIWKVYWAVLGLPHEPKQTRDAPGWQQPARIPPPPDPLPPAAGSGAPQHHTSAPAKVTQLFLTRTHEPTTSLRPELEPQFGISRDLNSPASRSCSCWHLLFKSFSLRPSNLSGATFARMQRVREWEKEGGGERGSISSRGEVRSFLAPGTRPDRAQPLLTEGARCCNTRSNLAAWRERSFNWHC